MHAGAFIVVICAMVLTGWSALGLRWRRSVRRDVRHEREWQDMVRSHSDLDTELDRVWRSR